MGKLSDGRFAGSEPVIISEERRPPDGVDDPTKLRNATYLDGIFLDLPDNNESRKELG
jgi:hypothetical protein